MEVILPGIILGTLSWKVFESIMKYQQKLRSHKFQAIIERQAERLINQITPYKKLKTNNKIEKKIVQLEQYEQEAVNEMISEIIVFEHPKKKTVLEEVKLEKFQESRYVDNEKTFEFRPYLIKKESKKNKDTEFSFSSQPQLLKKEVKRCRKFSHMNVINSMEDLENTCNQTPPREVCQQSDDNKSNLILSNAQVTGEKQRSSSPVQLFSLENNEMIKPIGTFMAQNYQLPQVVHPEKIESTQYHNLPVLQNQKEGQQIQSGNLFASLLTNNKPQSLTQSTVIQTSSQNATLFPGTNQINQQSNQNQANNLFSTLQVNTIQQQLPLSIPQQQSTGGLFANLGNLAIIPQQQQQSGGGLFSNFTQNNNSSGVGLFSQALQNSQKQQEQEKQSAQEIKQLFGSPQIPVLQNNSLPQLSQQEKEKNEAGQLMGGNQFNINNMIQTGTLFGNSLKK